MKLSYNITGTQRKSLVGAISDATNSPTKYLGAPTFAYEVGNYRIDKTGTVTGNDNELLVSDLAEQGFTAAEVVYENTYSEVEDRIGSGNWMGEPVEDDSDGPEWHDKCDREDRDEYGNWNGSAIPYYREPHHTEEEPDRLTLQMPLTGFTPEKLDNLCKLVNSKAPLLKASLGATDLPIQQTAETLDFPWFRFTEDGATVNAYSTLISLLCKTAKEKQRVTAKVRADIENPKYAMRCWLLSLGMIGAEYKAVRKILLANLDGNSSFKSGSRRTEAQDDISE